MTDPFQRPSNEFYSSAEHEGRLVLFENVGTPYETSTKSNAPGETSTAIDADVTVIDAPGGAKVYPKSRVFGQAVVGTLSRAKPGSPLLGRIKKGQASPGKSAPWIIEDYTDADAQLAGAYLTQRATGSFQGASGVGQQTTTTTPPAAPNVTAPAAAPAQTAVDLNDPAVQAALAALSAQGVTASAPSEPPF